ncbi:MAG: FecR domain-containing protein [Chitinophaga sp.]|uniref:FecR family protein n=1 Tax=Chitinophaga sp. TaxID=1869181 RepID=UPI001B2E2E5C|nr:FecR family protein [Chitinophaga sp.]MBO9732888.1 FecR domain-containing protein [Chitinophaga sp.]
MGEHDKKISDWLDKLSQQNKEVPFTSDAEKEQAKQRLLQSILANAAPAKPKIRLLTRVYRIAGSVAAAVFLFLGIRYVLHSRVQEEKVSLTWISTGVKEHKRVLLPDSSVVTLNANSQISFSNHFNKEDRIVTLHKGEAFFDVQPQPARPFKVFTDSIVTTVLGTSFNVIKYQHSAAVKITVKTGKVGVGKAQQTFCQLLPADQVLISSKDYRFTSSHEEGLAGDEWTSGRIVMREEPLSNILERLEMIYGVEFDKHTLSDDSLRTITFNAGMPLQSVLSIVEKISNVRFSSKDQQNKIHLYVK